MNVLIHVKLQSHPLDIAITLLDNQSYNLEVLSISNKDPLKNFSNMINEISMLNTVEQEITGILDYSYTSIKSNTAIGLSTVIAVRHNSKIIDFIQIERNGFKLDFKIIKSIETKHQLNYFQITIDKTFILSWSLDGLIFMWNLDKLELLLKYQAHSGNTYGVKRAICTPSGEWVNHKDFLLQFN